jgi:SAM-dependent methyltransferase
MNYQLVTLLSRPFGTEYAWRPTWRLLERYYVRTFGLVDLPGRLRARVVMQESLLLHPRKVLDLGSGTGCYSFYLGRLPDVQVSGVEINNTRISESCHIAERLERNNVKFYLGTEDAHLKSFSSESFDMALAIEVLQYLPDVKLTLKEIYRVLMPGGYLLGHVPVLGHLRPTETILFDDEKIQQMLAEANFEIVRFGRTFGGIVRKLCAAYDRISRSRVLVELLFPFFLLASRPFKVEATKGDYRFFVARKPAEIKEREQSSLEDRPSRALRTGNRVPLRQKKFWFLPQVTCLHEAFQRRQERSLTEALFKH